MGLVVSILLLWWTLHDVNLREVWDHLRRVRVVAFLGAVAVATATFPLRAIRWQYLLRYENVPLPLGPLWHATAIGFMANNLLPARAGEFARAYTVHHLTPVRFSTAFASIAVERVLDGLTLAALLTASIWLGGFASGTAVGGVTLGGIARGTGGLFAALLVFALILVRWPSAALGLTRRTADRVLPRRAATRLVDTLGGLLDGLEALRNARRFIMIALWSLVVWGVNTASFGLAFIAFDIQVPWSAALLLGPLIAFGVAIPSSPGFFGPFEAACRVGLAIYGVAPGSAVSYAVGYHIATFVPITVLGIWSLGKAHVGLRELRAGGAPAAGTAQR